MRGCDFANSLVTAADIRAVDTYLDKVRAGSQSVEQSVCNLGVSVPLHAMQPALPEDGAYVSDAAP